MFLQYSGHLFQYLIVFIFNFQSFIAYQNPMHTWAEYIFFLKDLLHLKVMYWLLWTAVHACLEMNQVLIWRAIHTWNTEPFLQPDIWDRSPNIPRAILWALAIKNLTKFPNVYPEAK